MADNPHLRELDALREAALAELGAISGDADIEAWRVEYLGRSGKLTQILRSVSTLPVKDRPIIGAAGMAAAYLSLKLKRRTKDPKHFKSTILACTPRTGGGGPHEKTHCVADPLRCQCRAD